MRTKILLTLIALTALTACSDESIIKLRTEELISTRESLGFTESSLALKQESAARLEQELADVQLVHSKLTFSNVQFDKDDRRIDITIQNTSDIPITAISFKARLESPGRTFPWAHAEFFKPFQGGLEIGEKARFEVTPGMRWQTSVVMARDDLEVDLRIDEIYITEIGEALTVQSLPPGISGSLASDIKSANEEVKALEQRQNYLIERIASLETSINVK